MRWIVQASYQYNTSPLLGSFPSRACTAQFRRAPPHRRVPGCIFLDFEFGFVPNFARGFSSSTRAVSAHPNIDVGKEGEPSQLLLHHTAHPPRSPSSSSFGTSLVCSVHSARALFVQFIRQELSLFGSFGKCLVCSCSFGKLLFSKLLSLFSSFGTIASLVCSVHSAIA